MTTIRAQLQWRLTILTSVLLVVASTGIYLLLRSAMVAEFDSGLRKEVQALSGLVEFEEDGNLIEFESSPEILSAYGDSPGAGFIQIWNTSGSTVWRSPSLGDIDLPRRPEPLGILRYFNLALPGIPCGRAVSLSCTPRSDIPHPPPVTMVLARDAASLDHRLDTFLAILATCTLLEILGAVWIGRSVVSRRLRPLQRVAEDIEGISAESLYHRLDAAPLAGELKPIVQKLNELFVRLETSFDRERRFSADVAHELRTPITGLRSLLEVTLERGRDPGEYRNTMEDLLAIVLDTQGVVEKMLEMARAERGDVNPRPRKMILSHVLDRAWKPFRQRCGGRNLELHLEIPDSLEIQTDPDIFHIILSNLLENACEHADPGGTVRVQAEPDRSGIHLRITNPASTLNPGDVNHVFERFWRGEKARSETGTHAGLGLGLVSTLVGALGGAITAHLEAGRFSVNIHLPDIPLVEL